MPIFSHTVTGYLFALLATVVWSGNFVVARGLAGALSPVELSFWRWSIAFLTILPFAGRSLLRSLPLVRGTWGKVILMALLGITCFNTFIYQAGHTTDATNMSLLATASPIVMAAIAHLFLRERLSRFQFFGLCGALCGVIILVSRGRLGTLLGLRFAQGDLWMILSVFLFAVYSLMLRCRPKAFPQKAFLALLIGIGVLGLIPPLLWQAADTGLSPLDGSILSALIYIGVGASVVSFLAWSLAIERIGMVRAGIIYNSIPLFASLEATLVLGESITLPQMIGGVLIIGGICYASFGDLYAARRLLEYSFPSRRKTKGPPQRKGLFSISMFLVVVFFELFRLSGRKPSLLGEPRRDAAFLGKSGGHALPLIPIVIVARLPVSEPARIDLVFPGNALPAVAVVTQGANTGFAHSRDVRHRADSRPFEA